MLPALADEHGKAAIVQGLRMRGMDVITAQQYGFKQADDEQLLLEATRQGRLLLTNDTGFLPIDARWAKSQEHHAGIVFWPQARRSVGEVIRRVLAYARTSTPQDAADRVTFL